MMATAPNDSQNPGHSTAHGSSSTTKPSAAHSTCETLVMRPDQSAAATTVSMYSVRCAGMPKPASSTYSSATPAPVSAATFCAGSSSGSCARVKKERRHSADASMANSPAIMVMCRPEIEIRWLMPVRLNTAQSDWSIARWSPTTSATITPAYCLPGNARRMRSRSLARQCSTRLPMLKTKLSSRRFLSPSGRT